ncbi:hypothetical protein LAZ67_16002664 [Cordylochernes scorpioides]|uniref:Transposase n=1 Tax=Cordylochernes scorpioides TaxID=51811 RepID=A0ABY6LGC5_9ARAC|nr:hypothetical protein LAZ67_16002664 [Cordylochernes scorpioides]
MEAPLKDCTTLEQRAVIRFLNAEGIQTSQICQRMINIYGESCLSQKTFINGLTSSKMDELHVPILSDLDDQKNISIFTIADNLNISYGTVHTIIKEQLQFRKICCRWIPHFLNLDQKLNRIRVSKALLKRYDEEGNHFLDQIMRVGVIIIILRQNVHLWNGNEATLQDQKKIRSQRSAGKVLLTIFWDVDGPICLDFLSSRQRMNSDFYCDILVNKLKPGISNKRRGKLSKVLEHPAYSPDLAPSDYFLFGLLKKELKGKRFDSDEDVQKVMQDFFHTLPKSAYKEVSMELPLVNVSTCELHSVIHFFMAKNETAVNINRNLVSVYGEGYMSIQMVHRDVHGLQNVHDDERSSRPVTATDNAAVAAVRNVVEADRRVTIDEIIIQLPPGIEIGRSSIGTIMSDVLNFRKVCARWVLRLLSKITSNNGWQCWANIN